LASNGEKNMRALISIFVVVAGCHSALADWSTAESESRATKLTCKGMGRVGVYYIENNGWQAEHCKVHCEWLETAESSPFSSDSGFDVEQDFKGAKASISPNVNISLNQNATITCTKLGQ
jgi:hypothetical protein